jgi:hypothetical protein
LQLLVELLFVVSNALLAVGLSLYALFFFLLLAAGKSVHEFLQAVVGWGS